jgi:hypothetical protein
MIKPTAIAHVYLYAIIGCLLQSLEKKNHIIKEGNSTNTNEISDFIMPLVLYLLTIVFIIISNIYLYLEVSFSNKDVNTQGENAVIVIKKIIGVSV